MRKAKPKKRVLLPDPKFGEPQVTRFVNDLMMHGKKTISFQIFYDALELIEKKKGDVDISAHFEESSSKIDESLAFVLGEQGK